MSKTEETRLNMRQKILFPIGLKLIVLFSILLGIVAFSTIFIATKVFIENNTTLIQQMSMENATQLAVRQRKILEGYQAKLIILGKIFFKEPAMPTRSHWEWQSEKALLGFFLYEVKPGAAPTVRNRILAPRFDEFEDPQGEKILQIIAAGASLNTNRVVAGETLLSRIQFGEEGRFFALGTPFLQEEGNRSRYFTVGIFEEKDFLEAFREGDAITSFLVSAQGELLAPVNSMEVTPESIARNPLVEKMRGGAAENYQTTFTDMKTGIAKIGAFHTVGFAGLAVVSEIPELRALEIVDRVKYRAGLVAGFVLSIAFLFTYIFSKSLTSPIKRLVNAAQLIREGNFHVRIKANGHDEVSHLGNTFNEMAAGLEERDRVKEVFSRFHNQQIADKILSGELTLGGERREAVIFFSDLRDFTSISENLEPERVVEMINEYFTRMVAVIHRHHGIVDKYVGDAIVALWGIPLASDTALSDALSACLEMREELKALNEIRISRGQEPLRMGMGLHKGTVIVGNIGSDVRMEYTAIGDSMNLASRIQSKTKELKEDLLVSEAVARSLGDTFAFESMGETFVKGKTQGVNLYRVIGPMQKKLAA